MTAVAGAIKAQSLTCDYQGSQRSYSYVVDVEAAVTDGPLAVCLAAGLPQPLRHVWAWQGETDDAAVCRSLQPKQVTPTHWEVTCEFSTHSADGDSSKNDPARNSDNPLQEPPDIEFRPLETNLVLPADLDGLLFTNCAWDPYEPEVATVEWAMGELLIRRNEANPSWSLWHEYANAVNEGPFYGASPGCVRFCPPTVREKYRANTAYVEVQYRFLFDERGLEYHTVVNEGDKYWELVGSEWIKRCAAAIDKGTATGTTVKVLLDSLGRKVADQQTALQRANILARPESWVRFRVRPRKDFSALRLGG